MAEAMLQSSAFDDGHPERYDPTDILLNQHRAGQGDTTQSASAGAGTTSIELAHADGNYSLTEW